MMNLRNNPSPLRFSFPGNKIHYPESSAEKHNTNNTCFIMAAPAKKMVGVSDSSSSDDEELRRCQEAVWETKTIKTEGFWLCCFWPEGPS